MELEEAKRICNEIIQTNMFNRNTDANAIEAVLQALDNSIPKEKVKSILGREIKQLEDDPQYSWVGSEWSEREVVEELQDIQKELLEE